VPKSRSAVDRLKRRIDARLAEDSHKPMALRRTQKGLADHIGVSKGTLHDMLYGQSAKQGALARLDRMADYLGLSPSELVQMDNATLMELSPAEHAIIRHWREWPKEIQAAVLRLLAFSNAVLPDEDGLREFNLLFRQLKTQESRTGVLATLRDALAEQHKRQFGRPRATAGGAQGHSPENTVGVQIPRGRKHGISPP
jgi:transcriptional regulator with XRE-family HTH domain